MHREKYSTTFIKVNIVECKKAWEEEGGRPKRWRVEWGFLVRWNRYYIAIQATTMGGRERETTTKGFNDTTDDNVGPTMNWKTLKIDFIVTTWTPTIERCLCMDRVMNLNLKKIMFIDRMSHLVTEKKNWKVQSHLSPAWLLRRDALFGQKQSREAANGHSSGSKRKLQCGGIHGWMASSSASSSLRLGEMRVREMIAAASGGEHTNHTVKYVLESKLGALTHRGSGKGGAATGQRVRERDEKKKNVIRRRWRKKKCHERGQEINVGQH